VGQLVSYSANVGMRISPGGYRIIRLLPPEGRQCLYRIKSADETFERVAREQELAGRQSI